jgi:glycosyltransferase involved in cell wall biosynthesis
MLSITIPVYNEEQNIPILYERLVAELERLGRPFEIILVNDGSADGSEAALEALCRRDSRVKGVNFRRNFGQTAAMMAGINYASGDIIIPMDGDLQNDPADIARLLAKLEEGYDVVYGAPELMRHSLFRNLLSRATKLALARAMGVSSIVDINAFRVLRTDVRRAFEGFRSPNPMIDVLLSWGTVRFASVSVPHEVRRHGRSNYTIGMLFNQAMLLLTGFSTGPLRAASILGFGFTLFGIAVFVYVIAVYFLVGSVPGFPFLAAIIALFSGAQMFALGIMGEYLARMFNRTMERPGYVVGREAGEVQRTGARWVDAPSGDLPHALRATAVRGAAGRE